MNMEINKDTLPLFLDRVDVIEGSGCLIWSGHRMSNGYGVLFYNNESMLAHRFAYLAFVGSIPVGHVIHHDCGNRSCVNTFHLECVSRGDHVILKHNFNGDKTVCRNGHKYTSSNTYYYKDKHGRPYRKCKECIRIRDGHKPRIPIEKRTHCSRGHNYSENSYIRNRKDGSRGRECHACALIAQRKRRGSVNIFK